MASSSPDVQPVRDNDVDASGNAGFFNGCREASRYTVNEVIGKGRCDHIDCLLIVQIGTRAAFCKFVAP